MLQKVKAIQGPAKWCQLKCQGTEHITHFATDLEVVAMALLIWAQNVLEWAQPSRASPYFPSQRPSYLCKQRESGLTVEEHLGLCVSQIWAKRQRVGGILGLE